MHYSSIVVHMPVAMPGRRKINYRVYGRTISFRPDVRASVMLSLLEKQGIKKTFLINHALREYLPKKLASLGLTSKGSGK